MTSTRPLLALLLWLALPGSPAAQVADPAPNIPVGQRKIMLEPVVSLPDSGSASRPKARPMTLIGDGSGRRFVVDQNGLVYQLHADDSLSVFLDLAAATSLVVNYFQQGLSSAAFHPDFHVEGAAGEGLFYTSSTQTPGVPDFALPGGAPAPVHDSVVHEWQVSADPDAIDPGSARELLRVAEGWIDHNVGQIAFDPNLGPGDPDYGLLYVAMGDGGNQWPVSIVDPLALGQDTSHPLGTILRIDPLPSGPDAYGIPTSNALASDGDPSTLGEIWAFGLRNPHRFSWDTGGTGRMLVSDIGQRSAEEIVLGANGANFGWSEREGTYVVQPDDETVVHPLPPDDALFGFTYPVIQYDQDENDHAISGGYVYRGDAVPTLTDHYLFGDLRSGRMFVAHVDDLDGSGLAPFETLRLVDGPSGTEQTLKWMVGNGVPQPRTDLRFGRDDDGELYVLTKRDGRVRRILAPPACDDGIDNDDDGEVDAGEDVGCLDSEGLDEAPACQDGVDNDGDGGIDFDGGAAANGGSPLAPADEQCELPWVTREQPKNCGLGPEAALAIAVVLAWRRRGGRAWPLDRRPRLAP